jgi:hypothetical protein
MPFEKTGRYRQLGLLGRGTMGSVYRALDTASGRTVAIKTLQTLDPDFVFGLKKEFRALTRLSHPNLVELYELVADADSCFFTMELVEGAPFGQARPGDANPDARVAELRSTLAQLTSGLSALHAEGLLHRDIKPENVLVSANGHVVLLDCGLVSDFVTAASIRSQQGVLAGTPAYMSPEQASGERLTPATDFYSVGVMLHEVLTGSLPSAPGVPRDAAPRPGEEAPDWGTSGPPQDLMQLAADLLRPEASQRPTAELVLARLGDRESLSTRKRRRAAAAAEMPESARFVGRGPELSVLFEAFRASRDGGIQTVCVEGASGMGKTAIVEQFLDWVSNDALILRARCHPEEHVPFKAIDGVIDELTRHLMHEPADVIDTLLPRNVAALVRVFPVLARVPSIARVEQRGGSGAEPTETRRRAFRALRDLLCRVSDRVPLVVWVDDLQWGDLDSASLLRELRDPGEPARMLIVLAYRSEDRESAALRAMTGDIETEDALQRIALQPLSEEEAQRLVEHIVSDLESSGSAADAIVREAQGSPFFVREIAHHFANRSDGAEVRRLTLRVADVVRERVAEVPATARRVLDVVSVAGRPIEKSVAERAAACAEEMPHIVKLLTAHMLLRSTPLGDGSGLVPFHDRVRESVLERIPPHEQASIHRSLAEALESLPDPDPNALVHHYVEASEPKRAVSRALEAAERATEGLAFHRAASLYRRVIELPGEQEPTWSLHAKLGESLINAGRGAEGAQSLERAADLMDSSGADTAEAMRVRRSAAEHYLRSGAHEDGLRVLQRVLAAAGVRYPRTTTQALVSLIAGRARLGLPAARRPTSGPLERDQIDVCWSAGLGLSLFDPVRAAAFHIRHALLAQRLGDPEHAARAVGSQCLITAMEGGRRKARESARFELEAERLARATDNPNVEAHRLVMSAVSAFAQWRYRDALSTCDEGIALCRESCIGVTWELANLEACRIMSLAYLGDFNTLWQRLPELLRRADEDSDLYSSLFLRLGSSNTAWLARDRAVEARRQVDSVLRGSFPETVKYHIHQGTYALSQIDLYNGDFESSYQRVSSAGRELRKSGIMRHQSLRVALLDLHARSALALASITSQEGQRLHLLRFVRRCAKKFESESALPSAALGFVLRAGTESLAGRRSQADSLLVQAALAFDRQGMNAHANAARFWWAEGNPQRGDDSTRTRNRLSDCGIGNAERMAALLVPGSWSRAMTGSTETQHEAA